MSLKIVPTTTLTAQTANNTSAAATFQNQSNGNLGATNVSKVDVHSVLYPGSDTKVFAHLMLWFGPSNHMNVGYSSADAAQVHAQITDMISRGIDGVIIDWYGSGTTIDAATKVVMAEAEAHPGFTFAIMVDQGTLQWDSCSGCTPQQALLAQMQYVEQTYIPSSAYLRWNGKPVVTDFDIDANYSIDWNALNNALATKPAFVFQNSTGFTHTLTSGSYSWVMPLAGDYGMAYLADFYATGKAHPNVQTTGAAYKGFNDTLASWGQNRIMGQQCGQTWLSTLAKINSTYNSGTQLPWLQLVTWNDYEEGTEIESGIDNCASVSAGVTSNSLTWSLKGAESTVDHYTVYVSTDGQNLMPLSDFQPGNLSLNLCSFELAAGTYSLYVQAVGKPSIRNQISSRVSYTPTCSTANALAIKASPTSLTMGAGTTGVIQATVTTTSGSVNDAVVLECKGLPAGMQCQFSPASVIPGKSSAASKLTITAGSGPQASMRPVTTPGGPILYAGILPFGLAGIVVAGGLDRKRFRRGLFILLAGCVLLLLVSCGGGQVSTASQDQAVRPGSYSITIQGTSGTIQAATSAVIVVK